MGTFKYDEQRALQAPASGRSAEPGIFRAVQRSSNAGAAARAARARSARDVHSAAERGVSGSASALPHGDAVQASFGRHDVGGIQAHVGGAARAACGEIGARAFATGDHVAFASAPDLHTAAHVVQLRAGVQLQGGVGVAGDAYERNADAVADAVVAGRSAEGLLDEAAGSSADRATVQCAAVQRDGEGQAADDPEAWQEQRILTKDSFFDLVAALADAAEYWQDLAEIADPPGRWETAISTVGSLVAGAALGRLGKIAGDAVLSLGYIVKSSYDQAIAVSKTAVQSKARELLGLSRDQHHPALYLFCHSQKQGLREAGITARESFFRSAGTPSDQRLSIAQMQEIKALNDRLRSTATDVQHQEMSIGWMNVLAGGDISNMHYESLEETDNVGVLGLVIAGHGNSATDIERAQAVGINSHLRSQMAGTRLGDWTNADSIANKQGINVTAVTRKRGFGICLEDAMAARDAGAPAEMNQYVYFAIGRSRDWTHVYQDQDQDWCLDDTWGANAGRWFLDNVKDEWEIFSELDEMELPGTIEG